MLRRPDSVPVDKVFDFLEQAFEVHRLRVVIVAARLQRFLLIALHGVCGQGDYRNVLGGRAGLESDILCARNDSPDIIRGHPSRRSSVSGFRRDRACVNVGLAFPVSLRGYVR